jgi:glycosyltransferase involved in cell wall biosynthesis
VNLAVSIIIPTYNRSVLIRQCLDGVLAQRLDSDLEVIVVDDGSTDDTAQIVQEYPDVRLISQQNAGPAAARNHGVAEARGNLVVFIDDDCIPEPGWLPSLLAPFDNPEIAGAKGAYRTDQTERIARFVQIEYEEKYQQLSRHRYIDFIDTYSAAFRKPVFISAGGYDTAFPTASVEDQEFSFRLANAGHKMVFVPGARVRHRHVATLSGYFRKKFKIGFWKVRVVSKNPNKLAGDSHTPLSLKLQILLTAAFPFGIAALAFPPWGSGVVAVILGAYLVTTLPLAARCARRYPDVAVSAPFLIACRSAALTLGLAQGAVLKLLGDPRFRPVNLDA